MWSVRAQLAAERKVSFERDDLTCPKACHIPARGMCAAVLQESSVGPEREDCGSVISGAALNARRSK